MGGRHPGVTTEEHRRIKELERENFELRRASEILKKASAFLPRRSSTRDRAGDDRVRERAQGDLRGRADLHCTALQVAPSTYYAARSNRGLEMGIWYRDERLHGLVHQSDRGGQYLSIRYTERLADAGAVTSVGSRGDSYDNALAESEIGLYKTALIERGKPWKTIEEVELATFEWVHWFNHRGLHSEIGYVAPVEFVVAYRVS